MEVASSESHAPSNKEGDGVRDTSSESCALQAGEKVEWELLCIDLFGGQDQNLSEVI